MNKYEIVGIVGEGAYGIVYKAKNKDNGESGKHRLGDIPLLFYFDLISLSFEQLLLRNSKNQQMKMKSSRKPQTEKSGCSRL